MNRKLTRTAGLALVALVLLATAAQPVGIARAEPGAWIGVVPDTLQIAVDSSGVNEIKVGDVINMYGVEFHLAFNPACVQVKGDADPSTPGIQIEVGSLLSGSDAFVAKNDVDNAKGTIDFVATLKHPAMPVTGGGTVARITWTAKCASTLKLSGTKLGDVNGLPINPAVKNGNITIPLTPAPKVYGTVLLQGRTTYANTEVFLTEEPCPSVIHSISALAIPNVPTAKTAANGYFEILPYPGRTYMCLSAFRHGYLVAQKSLPITHPPGDAGVVTLPAGDMNQDDCINIFDLALVASHYGTSDVMADVNGDGAVDVYDLSLVGGNYGKCGPVNW